MVFADYLISLKLGDKKGTIKNQMIFDCAFKLSTLNRT
ncbi:hypothetical protein N644_1841 [Lactiplantibacillus paraplantarum]|nr:hypothetical protein N644_1841 [Lactiplantibacillus paraplantarum]